MTSAEEMILATMAPDMCRQQLHENVRDQSRDLRSGGCSSNMADLLAHNMQRTIGSAFVDLMYDQMGNALASRLRGCAQCFCP